MSTSNNRKRIRRLAAGFGSLLRIIPRADGREYLGSRLVEVLSRETHVNRAATGFLPLKHERLAELRDKGFNTPRFRAWLRGQLHLDELHETYLEYGGRISLRNFEEEIENQPSPRLPVAYEQSDWHRIADFCSTHNKQWHTLVNEALPLRGSRYCGIVILLGADRYITAYLEGYATPRDVEEKLPEELHVFLRRAEESLPADVPEVLRAACDITLGFLPERRPVTLEFSIYPYPVGVLVRPEIFWEWRGSSFHDLSLLVTRLLERVDSYEMKFALSLRDTLVKH